MKTILLFDTEEPEEKKELYCCIKAKSMAIVLFEVQYNLGKTLYDDGDSTFNLGIEATITRIREYMEENGIVIDDLIN